MGNGAWAIGPKLPRPSSTLPTYKGCWAKFFSAKRNTEAASLPMTSLVSALGELRGCRCAQPIRPRRCVLIPAVGRKAKELALHCVDPGDIGRDEVIAAAFFGQHLKLAAGRKLGRGLRR